MRLGISLVALVLATIAAPRCCPAGVFLASSPSSNIAISDNGYNGTLGSMASLSCNVTVSELATDVNVLVGINHTFVGDLVIKLVSPENTVVTLLSRPGFNESADNGSGIGGDSSNLSSSFPLTYDDEATSLKSAELMGSTIGNAEVIGRDGMEPRDFIPAHGAAFGTNLSDFDGENAAGTWRLYVGDAAPGEIGTLIFFTVYGFTVPAGDYNGDGVVDAADYVAWRKNDGTQAGYNGWRMNFGETVGGAGAAASANAAVPEPWSSALIWIGLVVAPLFLDRFSIRRDVSR
ncbi:MAG: proprotein convertase P-domain-containing protein [Planctomycetes bacterium]|nr:proprotein convertase P-domain-containing protein [Planctomycetota bacterium]